MKLNITTSELAALYRHYGLNEQDAHYLSLELSPKDTMYENNVEGADYHYIKVGMEAVSIVKVCLSIINNRNVQCILDFGGGYGRVLRFLVNQFPEAQISTCELEQEPLRYCANTFGVQTFQSSTIIANLPKSKKYDLIWAGSVFTHLSQSKFKSLFEYFLDGLNEGGILVFSTHGRKVENNLRINGYGLSRFQKYKVYIQYKLMGFGYEDYPNIAGYGVSINTPHWLMKFLSNYGSIEIVGYFEKYWDSHQDVICVKKSS